MTPAAYLLAACLLAGCGSDLGDTAGAAAAPAPTPTPAMYCVPLSPELCADILDATGAVLPGCEEFLRY